MNQFIQKYDQEIAGTLTGFDRIRFRGTLRRLCYPEGLRQLVWATGGILKEFGKFAAGLTKRVREASLGECERLGRPYIYLHSSVVSKEEVARKIVAEESLRNGLICVVGCVEPCMSVQMVSNPKTHLLELASRPRKCLHLYHYYLHPVFGFMSARFQTWLPLSLQICINSREWLAREMSARGMRYERRENCFTYLEDFEVAQALMDEQLRTNFPLRLGEIADQVNPYREEFCETFNVDYYWTIQESEWATDIVFSRKKTLQRLYPLLLRHAMTTLRSEDVMRFLGRKLSWCGAIPPTFEQEIISDMRGRQEGVRIKHRVGANSVKMYDKAFSERGSVLRIETTMNDPSDFKVYRTKEGDPAGEKEWRDLRRGVADIHRRAQICQRANERYLDAMVSLDQTATLSEFLSGITRPIPSLKKDGRKLPGFRALNPFGAEDLRLMEAISSAEFTLGGLRNRDLQRLLFEDEPASPEEARKRSAWVSRKLRLLRAHGLLAKVPSTHRYLVPPEARRLITAVLTARHTPVRQLLPNDMLQEAA